MKLITHYNRIILPIIIILIIISVIASYFLIKNVLQNELDEALGRTGSRIRNFIKDHDEIPVVTSFGEQIIRFEKTAGPSEDSGFSSTKLFIPEQNKNHISRKLVFPLIIKGQSYKIIISEPLEGTRHLTYLIVKIAIVTILATLLVLSISNRLVLSKLWKPFYHALGIMRSFKIDSKVPISFPQTSTTEFKLMTDHFKMATDSAKKEYQLLKEFSENASHESQTPLAIIRSKLDLLVQQENLSEKQSDYIESIYGAVNRLSKLNQSLLLLTKINNSQFGPNIEICLKKKITEYIQEFQELWQNHNIGYTAQLAESKIEANNELIDLLLTNLLSNATWHNIPGGCIYINLFKNKLTISNNGKGEPLDKDRIMQRFYKASQDGNGNGLGLSIIKNICDASGIDIEYSYSDGSHYFCLSW